MGHVSNRSRSRATPCGTLSYDEALSIWKQLLSATEEYPSDGNFEMREACEEVLLRPKVRTAQQAKVVCMVLAENHLRDGPPCFHGRAMDSVIAWLGRPHLYLEPPLNTGRIKEAKT